MLMFRDTIVEVPTPDGITSDLPGINKTSSYVNPIREKGSECSKITSQRLGTVWLNPTELSQLK